MGKILSGMVGFAYIIFTLRALPIEIAMGAIVMVIFSVHLIWFGDSVGFGSSMIAPLNMPRGITGRTPGVLIKFMGWVFLVLLPILYFVLRPAF